jgi:phosphoglycerate dehydrogenase-like enzyme
MDENVATPPRALKVVLIGEAGTHQDELEELLSPRHRVYVVPGEAAHSGALDEGMLADADVVVTLRLKRDQTPPPWGMLQVPGAGLDGIELDRLRSTTAVCNVFEHEIPLAEFVLGSLLDWEIRPDALRRDFSADTWSDTYRHRTPHGEVYGKRLGLIGFGRVGRAIAARASAFGIEVVAVDGYAPAGDGIVPRGPESLPEILSSSDYLVVTCPLTAETRGMLDRPAFEQMKGSALLVNVARAEIVDEDALYEALVEHRIAGAVLDVWYQYPRGAGEQIAPSTHDFAGLDNAWCTPHSSAWTTELSSRRYRVIADNIERFADGRDLRNLVRQGVGTPHYTTRNDPEGTR